MAAAINIANYYCHQCDSEVLLSGEGNCQTCNDGFIEKIESDTNMESDEDELNFFHIVHHIPSGSGSDSEGMNGSMVSNINSDNGNSMLGQLIQNLIGNLVPTDFRSDPSDYIFSEQSFDNIVTRIMDQFEQPGPLPASNEDLEKLKVKVISKTKDHDTCSICLSEYETNEMVTELPCQHTFHKSCVFSWLKKNGSCPICRKNLSDNESLVVDNNEDEVTTTSL